MSASTLACASAISRKHVRPNEIGGLAGNGFVSCEDPEDPIGTRQDATRKKKARFRPEAGFIENPGAPERVQGDSTPGSDLLSHTPAHAVPSAVAGLTSVFGMGTGVTLPL